MTEPNEPKIVHFSPRAQAPVQDTAGNWEPDEQLFGLEELLQQLKNGYVTANTVDCYFKEQIEIRHEYVKKEYMMNLGYTADPQAASGKGQAHGPRAPVSGHEAHV